jgi:glutamine synthetase
MFDGSSIEGFVRIEESDMLLSPDLSTFQLFPWGDTENRVARLICDINTPDGRPFDGDPRAALKRQIARAAALGYTMNAGMEAEFFMFKPGVEGEAATITNDVGGYFDLAPADLGEDARRAMVDMLERMGFEVEAAHHEVAHGQHEIDFRYADALKTADNIATFRFVVKHVARQFGLVASFMPKPIFGQNGSGMHTHQSLFRGDENAFFDEHDPYRLSPLAKSFMAGLLRHAGEITAITNQTVNSYKRLIPGFEAPVHVSWARNNRSGLIRVPIAKKGNPTATRIEYRSPDPACNPYLAFSVILAAGMRGIAEGYELPEEADANLFEMDDAALAKLGITQLPQSLSDALTMMERSQLVQEALGEHIFEWFLRNKRREWRDYKTQVSQFEIDRYLRAI